jgi:hypothetical protein
MAGASAMLRIRFACRCDQCLQWRSMATIRRATQMCSRCRRLTSRRLVRSQRRSRYLVAPRQQQTSQRMTSRESCIKQSRWAGRIDGRTMAAPAAPGRAAACHYPSTHLITVVTATCRSAAAHLSQAASALAAVHLAAISSAASCRPTAQHSVKACHGLLATAPHPREAGHQPGPIIKPSPACLLGS